MGAHTLHCALENEADLYVNERQIRHYHARSTEERRIRRRKEECQIAIFLLRAVCVRKFALYSDVIHSFYWKSAVEHDDGV